jgi:4-hydroxy-tetrahydrodipicolinate synthase
MKLAGIWVPLVTPFCDSRLDLDSMGRLVDALLAKGISGVVAAATTGESPLLSEEEQIQVALAVKARVRGRVPVLVGVGGADTRKAVESARRHTDLGVDGLLAVSPAFIRPDQRGLLAHFEAIAAATPLPVVLYNIPYRTGVNLTNDTIRRLARIQNIVGLKDCCGDLRQSMELLRDRPPGFSILTGEDAFFHAMLAAGADGGILASAHWATETFVELWRAMQDGDLRRGRALWSRIAPVVPLLFEEPNPAPLKHVLHRLGVIASGEVRLPLVSPSDGLARRLEVAFAGSGC